MKIKNNKKRLFNRKNLIISISSIILIGAISCVFYFNKDNLLNKNIIKNSETKKVITDYNPATQEQQNAGSQTKSGSSDVPIAPIPIEGSDKKSVSLQITATNQTSSALQIRTVIGAIENDGICTITLTSVGKNSITKTSQTQAQASISTCQGFDIPISELSSGTWHITIEFSSNTLTGIANLDKVIK